MFPCLLRAAVDAEERLVCRDIMGDTLNLSNGGVGGWGVRLHDGSLRGGDE